jgi:succinoglycan biosynthesis protein ExoV
LPRDGMKYVLGSGFGHGEEPVVDDTWHVAWVRGPETAALLKRLTGQEYKFITDGAIMLREIYGSHEKLHEVSLIPHCSACTPGAWAMMEQLTKELGIHLISPEQHPADVVRQISQSHRLLTEALHGAIVADTFGVPWLPIEREGILRFKWIDWTASMGLSYEPSPLTYRTSWFPDKALGRTLGSVTRELAGAASRPFVRRQLEKLVESREWHLSDRKLVDTKISEIKSALDRLKRYVLL